MKICSKGNLCRLFAYASLLFAKRKFNHVKYLKNRVLYDFCAKLVQLINSHKSLMALSATATRKDKDMAQLVFNIPIKES